MSLNAKDLESNKASYISFELPKHIKKIKKVILNVTGKVDVGDKPFLCHVYAIPSKIINEALLNWNNAPHLDDLDALIHDVGNLVHVAGQIGFSNQEKNYLLDVTDVILKNDINEEITFVLIRETRQLGDDADKGRTLIINSKESGVPPRLDVWSENN